LTSRARYLPEGEGFKPPWVKEKERIQTGPVLRDLQCELEKRYESGHMSTVADQLREAREAKQLTIHTWRKPPKCGATMSARWRRAITTCFSAPVYIRGSVRTYAALLKLDVVKIMASLDGELSKTDRHHDHPPLTDQPRSALDWLMYQMSRVNWTLVLPTLIIGVLLVGGYWTVRIWRNQKAKDPLTNLGPGTYKPPARSGGETLPLPPARR